MQYKTVTITKKVKQKKKTLKDPSVIGIEYEKIINQQLADGWKLVGIHPIKTKRNIGCIKFLCLGFMTGLYEHFQTDVFIFYRDDDTDEYTGPEYEENGTKKKKGESLKKAGSAMMNATRDAANFVQSGEAMNKLGGLKDKIQSGIQGNKPDDFR